MAELAGVVSAIIFRNEQNGYSVIEMTAGAEEFTAVGVMPFLTLGDRAVLRGDWTEHPTFGPQLKVSACDWRPPSTLEEIEKYLASGMINGVRKSTAQAIVETFGETTLDVMQTHPERLSEVPGIGQKRAAMIAESYQEQRGMRDVMLFLQRYDISPAHSAQIYKQYENAAISVIQKNPYKLVDDVRGVGFLTADRIAMRLGIASDSEFRLSAGIKHALREAASQEGHVYLPKRELIRRSCDLLEAPSLLIENTVSTLAFAREIVLRDIEYTAEGNAQLSGEYLPIAQRAENKEDGDVAVYLAGFHSAEGEVAMRLNLLRSGGGQTAFLSEAVEKFEKTEDVEFSPQQKDAVRLALRSGACVVTGGPGTGKTTIIKCIISIMEAAGKKAALCAPTGRAAKRMSEATNREAKTIHRLLEYAPGAEEYTFQKNEDDPLEFDALIVDETSMIDLFLMRSLLRAVRNGAQLVMVGDVDQLPSVGAGNVLRDIIDSETLPVARLNEIFRQARQSMIIQNAHKINQGASPNLSAREGDFFFDKRESLPSAAQAVVELCARRIPGYFHIPPQDVQVLCPMKRGEAGVRNLNQRLQLTLNPPSPDKKERPHGEQILREGDRVMHVKNNYQIEWKRRDGATVEEGTGVFNGDLGVVRSIDARARTVTVLFDDDREVVYEDAFLSEIELSYAMSIHKSQGSEFPAIVIPIVSGPPQLLTRNLLYTGITRAKKLVILVGNESAILRMVANDKIATRYSMLSARIRRTFEALP